MEINLKEKEGVHKVEIMGKVDVKDTESLEMFLRGLKARGIKNIILELSCLESIVSSAVGVLISLVDEFENSDGKIILVNPNVKILNIFKRMTLDEIFIITETEEAAINMLKS